MKQLILIFFSGLILMGFKSNFLNEEKINRVTYKVNLYNKDSKKPKDDIDFMYDKLDLFEFELYYNSNSSLYQMVANMSSKDEEDDDISILKIITDCSSYYKNLIQKEKVVNKNFIGQEFNVSYPFDQYKWEITSETKIINGFKCFKAVTQFEEFNSGLGIKRVFNPYVWFAPEIPVPFGPKGLDGLPGLVLEGTINGKMYYYATKIEFDIKRNIKIEKPTEGKNVTGDEFTKIVAEH